MERGLRPNVTVQEEPEHKNTGRPDQSLSSFIAQLLIHKPGPLSSEPPARLQVFANVYRRDIDEVFLLTMVITAINLMKSAR